MHLPRTVLTIALAASTATALPGWRSKTAKDDVKCGTSTCTQGGGDFYQGGNGDRMGGYRLRVVNPDNRWYQGGDRKGGSPVLTTRNIYNTGSNMCYEKEEGRTTPYRLEYTKGGQGSGHFLPRRVESNEKECDSKLFSYVKGGVVSPRSFDKTGKIHYETGNDHHHFWARHIEGPTSGDDFAQIKPTEGGNEFVAARPPTKPKNFVNPKNQGDDEFFNGGRHSNPDDFVQVKEGDDFYTGSRNRGVEDIDYSRSRLGGSAQNEISYQPKQPRDFKTNGGVWEES